jgi:hypothetical protein
VQVNEYTVVAASVPVLSLPLGAFAPLQPPDAMHDVAFVELHVSDEAPPLATTEGVATIVAMGITLTSAVATPLVPPAPVHASE